MKTRTTLAISLCILDTKEIEMVKNVHNEINITHREVYLLGIKQLENKNIVSSK